MLDHSFTFNGVDMRAQYGLIVSSIDDYLIPQMRERKIEIPGRNGAYDFDTKRGDETYKERQLVIHCATAELMSRAAVREMTYTLSRKGHIVRWDEPEKYYNGRIYNPDYIERIVRQMKRFDITFTCDPFAYGRQITVNWNAAVHNPTYLGTGRTPTYIAITNTSQRTQAVGISIRFRERS